MRFYCNINGNPRALVKTLGSDIPILSAEVKRRDAATIEFQPFIGDQVLAAPVQLAESYELRYACKAINDHKGSAVVFASDFVWKPTSQVYTAQPSFATHSLNAMFGGATAARRYGAAHTLVADDLGAVLNVDVSSTAAITIAPALGAATEKIWIVAVNHSITIAAGSGVTLADPDTLGLTVAGGAMVMITRASANNWKLSAPLIDGLDKVELLHEFTWRDLATPNNWTTAPTNGDSKLTVYNDVIRGDEGAPVDAEAATDYVTHEELDASYVRTNEAQSLTDPQKLQARENIGAIGDGVAVTYEDQDPTAPQQAQARDNIGAASAATLTATIADLDALDAAHTALDGVALKKTAQSLSGGEKTQVQTNLGVPAASALTALDGVVIKKTAQSLSDAEKLQARTNIGAAAAAGAFASVRQASTWNAVGNGTTVSLNGAGNSATGTATARSVQMVDAGRNVTAISGTTATSAAHGGTNNLPVQFSGTTLASPLVAGTWYYLRDVTTNTLAVAATPGGSAISLSGSISAMKVFFATGPAWHHRRIGYVSAATAGASCGTRHGLLQWAVSSELPLGFWTFNARFVISDAAAVANARMFVGLASTAAVLPNGNPSSLLNLIGLGADTGDSTLRIMHNDGTGTATRIDLGANFPCNTRTTDVYDLVLGLNADLTITYTVTNLTTGNQASGNLSTDLPMALILLSPQLWRNNGSTALAVALDVLQWSMTTSK